MTFGSAYRILLLACLTLGCQVLETDISYLGGRTKSIDGVFLSSGNEIPDPYGKPGATMASHVLTDIGVTFPDLGAKPCLSALILYPLLFVNPNIFNYSCKYKYSKEQPLSWGVSYVAFQENSYKGKKGLVDNIGGGIGLFLKLRLQVSEHGFIFFKYRGIATSMAQRGMQSDEITVDPDGAFVTSSLGFEGETGLSLSLIVDQFKNDYQVESPMTHSLRRGDWSREYLGLTLGWKFK